MFSRFRNLFKKSKHDNDAEEQPGKEYQIKIEIENENANENANNRSDQKETASESQLNSSSITGSQNNGGLLFDYLRNGRNGFEQTFSNGMHQRSKPAKIIIHTVSVCSDEPIASISTTTPTAAAITTTTATATPTAAATSDLNEISTSVSSVAADDLTLDNLTPSALTPTSLEERIAYDANNIVANDNITTATTTNQSDVTTTTSPTRKSTTIVINPTGNNSIACEAISQKLNDIAAIAGSLDAAIRDVQNGADAMETNSSTSSSEKKPNASGSSSGEDWQSRSTEDDSFATASEGNFTPRSHSSSFQTASGHTSLLHSSSNKTSFDASEADDSTLSAFEIPELMPSPNNISFDSSDHSFLSAKQETLSPSPAMEIRTPLASSSSTNDTDTHMNNNNNNNNDDDENSIADIEELHSQSVTPTPDNDHFQSIPIESETELESYIADAPSASILTEERPTTAQLLSRTPEVSKCSTNLSYIQYKQQQQQLQLQQQQQQKQEQHKLNQLQPRDTNNVNKTNAAWRRSKYYENITKQTIRGFL